MTDNGYCGVWLWWKCCWWSPLSHRWEHVMHDRGPVRVTRCSSSRSRLISWGSPVHVPTQLRGLSLLPHRFASASLFFYSRRSCSGLTHSVVDGCVAASMCYRDNVLVFLPACCAATINRYYQRYLCAYMFTPTQTLRETWERSVKQFLLWTVHHLVYDCSSGYAWILSPVMIYFRN